MKSLYELYQLSQIINCDNQYPDKTSDSGVVHTGISDHRLIYAIRKISVSKKHENVIEVRNMRHFDEQKFIRELQNQHWEYVYFLPINPNSI